MKHLIAMAILAMACSSQAFPLDAGYDQLRPATESTAEHQPKVNLNTADVKTIVKTIRGIGQRRAQAIVNYRTENGSFNTLDDLAKVRGISKRFVQKNQALLDKTLFVG